MAVSLVTLAITLIATKRFDTFSLAKKTLPKPPSPGLSGIHICCRKVLPSIVNFIDYLTSPYQQNEGYFTMIC